MAGLAGQPPPGEDDYDEFAALAEVASEAGLAPGPLPAVARRSFEVAPGRQVSAIAWGDAAPEVVLLHGGGQNAHTWDALALALGRPAVAIDLPGHGRSYWRPDRDYGPWQNAAAIAPVIERLAPGGACVAGMSLGGVTAIRLAAARPDLVSHLVVIDVTPQVNDQARTMSRRDQGSVALVGGPAVFDSFEAMVDAAAAASPRRPRPAVARGVRHNARRRPDGRWMWRYDLFGELPPAAFDFSRLWAEVGSIRAPVMLVTGASSAFVTQADIERFAGLLPGLRAEVVPGAGHAVQSDQPMALARLVREFMSY